ncbi:MAG: NAD(+) diphosphatase [Erysipelotrichaceae bacterium]|nr:NAD(+) diphosphatase [Erysipelotrichaceae bacterium]
MGYNSIIGKKSMIQDIYPGRYDVSYKPCQVEEDDYVFLFSKDRRTVLINNQIPRYKDLKDRLSAVQYLFSIDEERFFLGTQTDEDFEWSVTRLQFPILNDTHSFALATATHLYRWYSTHIYCGGCGHRLKHLENERALKCENCSQIFYPVIAPAVIVAVTNGEKLLMSRYAGREYRGSALLAGFCEIGETPEETCRREVMEEVGIRIRNIRYFASQPWGIESDLLLGFVAEVDDDDTIRVDHSELAEAVWIDRKDIEKREDLRSLTATMIEAFRTGKI